MIKALFLLAWLSGPASAQDFEPLSEAESEALPFDAPPPTTQFAQVLSAPRIGGRLTAITVDPADGAVFVGTEEGTLTRSLDGGLTWEEWQIDPFVVAARGVVLPPPSAPSPRAAAASTLTFFFDPPFSRYVDRVQVPGVFLPQYETLPVNASVFFLEVDPPGPTELLDAVTRTQSDRTRPVRRVAICPGAPHPMLVATKFDLYGSSDRGRTFVRLFGVPGNVEIYDVRCAPENPHHVLLGTNVGVYRSKDAGLTFDVVLAGFPNAPTNGTAFGANGEIFVAYGSTIFRGDPDLGRGLDFAFPNFNDASTAPWTNVQWIERTPSGEIWVATDDGLRRSKDDGITWDTPGRMLFDRQHIAQILRVASESGDERIAIMTDEAVYVTDDDGRSFYPLLQGQTRRTMAQLARGRGPGDIWLVAGGELWTTARLPRHTASGREVGDSRWARSRLRTTPPLDRVMNAVLHALSLDQNSIADLFSRAHDRAYAPRIDASFRFVSETFSSNATQMGTGPGTLTTNLDRTNWELFVQATFAFRDAAYTPEQLTPVRNQIHELQRQVGFVTEDAWHERRLLLMRIARGETNETQNDIYRERIAALEAILELWMGAPLASAN